MAGLSADQVADYQRDGYLLIDDFLSAEQVDALCAEVDRIVAERSGLSADDGGFNLEKSGDNPFRGDVKAAGVFRKIQSLAEISAPFRELGESPALLDIVAGLLGPEVYAHSNKLMLKPARHGSEKPWHQDWAYWRKQNPQPNQLSAWIALDQATPENGCLQVIPGSHRLGLLDHHRAELQVALEAIDLDRAVHCPVRPGGMVLFDCLTLHYSPPNQSDQPRRGMIYSYGATPDAGPRLR